MTYLLSGMFIRTFFNRHARKVHLFRNMFVFDGILHTGEIIEKEKITWST